MAVVLASWAKEPAIEIDSPEPAGNNAATEAQAVTGVIVVRRSQAVTAPKETNNRQPTTEQNYKPQNDPKPISFPDPERDAIGRSIAPDDWYAPVRSVFTAPLRASFRSELIGLRRSRSPSTHTSVHDLANTVALDTQQLIYNSELAGRFTLERQHDDGRSVELTYLGLNHWSDSRTARSFSYDLVSPFTSAFGPGGFSFDTFDDVFRHQIHCESDFHSAELNMCQAIDPWGPMDGVLFAGCRYVSFRENFEFLSVVDELPGADRGQYTVDTSNHLFGLQLGGRSACLAGERTTIALDARIGVFANASEQQSRVRNAGFLERQAGADDLSLAALGQLSLTGRYRLARNLECQIGYEFVTISGLSLAADQLDFVAGRGTQSRLNADGHLFMHGPSIGIEFHW